MDGICSGGETGEIHSKSRVSTRLPATSCPGSRSPPRGPAVAAAAALALPRCPGRNPGGRARLGLQRLRVLGHDPQIEILDGLDAIAQPRRTPEVPPFSLGL